MKYFWDIHVFPAARVAPHWGAWIEICYVVRGHIGIASHPTGVRGLKLTGVAHQLSIDQSHPTGVRGLKYFAEFVGMLLLPSHPTGVRGLKYSVTETAGCGSRRTPLGCVD